MGYRPASNRGARIETSGGSALPLVAKIAPRAIAGRGLKLEEVELLRKDDRIAPRAIAGRGLKLPIFLRYRRLRENRPASNRGARIETLPYDIIALAESYRPASNRGARIETRVSIVQLMDFGGSPREQSRGAD